MNKRRATMANTDDAIPMRPEAPQQQTLTPVMEESRSKTTTARRAFLAVAVLAIVGAATGVVTLNTRTGASAVASPGMSWGQALAGSFGARQPVSVKHSSEVKDPSAELSIDGKPCAGVRFSWRVRRNCRVRQSSPRKQQQ
jgi:hypothetical protein